MLRGNKTIKDSNTGLSLVIKDNSPSISYTKSNKLISALYMVTDIMDKDEPLRCKLRTLGTQIVSDVNSLPVVISNRIGEILSFLEISYTVGLISEMNFSILKKEFLDLEKALRDYGKVRSLWLEDNLLKTEDFSAEDTTSSVNIFKRTDKKSIGHKKINTELLRTRIGVQKGSTLMQALSDKASHLYNNTNNFNSLKRQRRDEIIRLLRTSGQALTITDIKMKAKDSDNKAEALISCGEKTLQRELSAMVKDGVLGKVGDKRWSRYSLP